MTAADTVVWHAGISADGGLVPGSVSAATSGGDAAEIEAATRDFIAALDAYNRDLNGHVPSENVKPDDDTISRRVTYAVGEVVRMLRQSGSDRSALSVETAWLAVLAGDIDDLHEHLVWEGIE